MTPEFVEFLLEAKARTYAATGDDAAVQSVLPGAKQFEHHRGEYVYRDIYFGVRHFVGQETVHCAGRPEWSMAYGGGVVRSDVDTGAVYSFLREALRRASPEQPCRGPWTYDRFPFAYACRTTGDINMFWGVEEIADSSGVVYRLRFEGGRVGE